MASPSSPLPDHPPGGASGSTDGNADRLRMPSRNPLPLSASQEAQVREVFNARVKAACAEEIKAFAECAKGHMLSISFACRPTKVAMNKCMAAHATPANYDLAREEWFAGRAARARERQRIERRKLEQEKFHREWWGLPERDADELRREEERLRSAERIGGFRSHRAGTGTGTGTGSGGAASR